MCERKEKIVELSGYTIECKSPFEISDGKGNFASHAFADIVLDYRHNECLNAVIDCIVDDWHKNQKSNFDELLALLSMSLEEYKVYVRTGFIPPRLVQKFEGLYLADFAKYNEFLG